ncbi:hypothetical protein DFH29DRAFT_1008429 [Suillus ampliporus]|nr:hypothetical protein DFH29DRAFT_1008429 [Suillus ampliporus]
MIHPSFAIPVTCGLGECNIVIFDLQGGTPITATITHGLGEHNVLIFDLGGGTLIAAALPYGLGECNVLIFDLGGGMLIAAAIPYGLGERNVLIFDLGGGPPISAAITYNLAIPYGLDKKTVTFEEDPSMCPPPTPRGASMIFWAVALVPSHNLAICAPPLAPFASPQFSSPPPPSPFAGCPTSSCPLQALLQATQLVHAPLPSTLVVTAVLLPLCSSTMAPPFPPALGPPHSSAALTFPHNGHELVVQLDFVL